MRGHPGASETDAKKDREDVPSRGAEARWRATQRLAGVAAFQRQRLADSDAASRRKMLSIGKISPENKTYHLEQVADSAEEYYTGRGEAEGEWLGIEMATYELGGKVEAKEFLRLLEGVKDAETGTLYSQYFTRRKNLAFDTTFSAPKSVSLMYAAGSDHVKQQVVEAHDTAVRAGYSYIERVSRWGRVSKDGEHHAVEGEGLFGAAFRHRTNRLGEPNLHSHVVTPNMIKVGEDQWTALDSNRIYSHAKAGGTIYQAALRQELTRRLGVEWGDVKKGQADVKGISRDVIENFSTRRDEIEADMHEKGYTSLLQGQVSALKTRLTKEESKINGDMFEAWQDELDRNGLTPEFVDQLCNRQARIANVTKAQAHAILDRLDDAGTLTASQSYSDRRRVIEAIADIAPSTISSADLERLADAWIRERGVVLTERGHGPVAQAKKLIAFGNRAVTTEAQLELEDHVLAEMRDRVGNGAGLIDPRALSHGMKLHAKELSSEQRKMVESILTSGNGIDVVIGDAGTGKTFALNSLRKIYEDAGYHVAGAALAARAARELGDGAHVNSLTVHRTLTLLDYEGVFGRKAGKTVLLIDEAAMLDTPLLARVLNHAASKQMKIVLVGDDKQLPPIGPGGVFRAAADRIGYSRLTENRRQRDKIDQEIVADFRDGRGAAGLERARLHGRLTITETHERALDTVYNGWSSELRPSESLMIAGLRDEVYKLNQRAQAGRLANGELGNAALRCGAYEYRVGDVVRCGQRDSSFRVANGDFGTVVEIDETKHEVTIELEVSGETRRVTLTREYVNDAEKFKLGYAITAHTAQGATYESAWTLMNDRTYREIAYTQTSRAKGQTHIVLVGAPVIDPDAPGYGPGRDVSEYELVVAALRNSQAQAMALDVGAANVFAGIATSDLVEEVAASGARLRPQIIEAIDEAAASTLPGQQIAMRADWGEHDAEDAQRYRDLINEIKLRVEQVVREQLEAPPKYLTRELGEVPADPAQREYWRRGAVEVEHFRTRWMITDSTDAFSSRSASNALASTPELKALRKAQRLAAMKRISKFKQSIEKAPLKMKGRSL